MHDLVATPHNPAPLGAELCTPVAADGARLRMGRFPTQKSPQGTIALFQGRAEYIEKYFETIGDLQRRGFETVALDWRGQGGSQRELANPRKGHIDDFAQYQRDLAACLQEMTRLACPKPWFALAHSMGAAILMEYAHDGGGAFARMVLTAPMVNLQGLRFPKGSRLLAQTLDFLGLGSAYIPGGRDASIVELPYPRNRLTSDPQRFARNAEPLATAPELAVGDATVGWASAAFRQMRRFELPDYTRRWRIPTLLVASSRDEIVSTPAIERFAQRLDIASLITIPGARHEILMERDDLRALFFAAFDAFIPGDTAEPTLRRIAE
jgi:lysophospholipase